MDLGRPKTTRKKILLTNSSEMFTTIWPKVGSGASAARGTWNAFVSTIRGCVYYAGILVSLANLDFQFFHARF